MKRYECHITIAETVVHTQLPILLKQHRWRYSRIDGDPQLGIGVRQYATKYWRDKLLAIRGTKHMGMRLQQLGYPVMRMKVEEIIFDQRVMYES